MKKILFIVGESGSGKTHLQNRLLDRFPREFNKVTSCTTRPKREGERDGIDYYFIKSPSAFESMIRKGEFLQYDKFGGHYYGTLKNEYNYQLGVSTFVCTPEGVIRTIEALGIDNYRYFTVFFNITDGLLEKRGIEQERIHRGNIRRDFMEKYFCGLLDMTDIIMFDDFEADKDMSSYILKELDTL